MPPKRKTEDEQVNGSLKRAKLERTGNGVVNGGITKNRSKSRKGATAATRRTTITRSGRERPVITENPVVPSQRVNVFSFGTGSICELGLGPKVLEVKRPRLNPLLPIDEIGVVQTAVGGTHGLVLDHIGRVWSWGQNDSGVLGRLSKEVDPDEDNNLNALESTPALVQGLPPHAKFVTVGASDNCSAAITSEGHLWAWGTFIDDGDKAFQPGVEIQRPPVHITSIKNAVQVVGGGDHLLILDKFGDVYSWGIGFSYQLGYPVRSNLRCKTIGPSKVVGVSKIKYLAAGQFHSFAIDINDKVYSWGLNNFGQCAIPDQAGSGKLVEGPTVVEFFNDKKVVKIAGGNHHSLFLTDDGAIWSVGETNFHQLGLLNSQMPKEHTVYEQDGTTASYVAIPVRITQATDDEENVPIPKFKHIACGSDHSLALAEDGSAWTWGFGEVYQLGHGKPAGEESPEDQEAPTRIRNTATTGVNLVWCGAGSQFSVLNGLPKAE